MIKSNPGGRWEMCLPPREAISMVSNMRIGALWDWDGVVIDSSRQHELSWERLAAEEGRDLPEDHFLRGFGKKNAVIIPGILKWTEEAGEIRRLSLRKEELYREILRETGEEPRLIPGVLEVIKMFHQAGIPNVVGTSTERENVKVITDHFGFREYLTGIVASEDVSRGKPDPEVFLKAADLADRSPEDCVVFEDSLHGLEAGLRGGMKVVAVATTKPEAELKAAGAHRIIPDFQSVDLPFLQDLFSNG